MSKTKILQKDAPILRKHAKSVPIKDIESKKIRQIIRRMKRALHAEEDGVAIAAPQIGESLRLFIVSGKTIGRINKARKIDNDLELDDLVFINPEIVKSSKKRRKMEEGCLSVRWLYGKVNRSEKVTLRAYDEIGTKLERGASGLLAQIFQHETDHLNGILFTDKAEDVEDIPPPHKQNVKFVFFGSSQFSAYVLKELEAAGFHPLSNIKSASEALPLAELKKIHADVFVVASFGKILSNEILRLPKHGTLNVHPSLLPELRGPAPIQNTILGRGMPGVSIIKMDEKVDHGPILAQAKVHINPWPSHYRIVEEKLGRAGGKVLGALLPAWIAGQIKEIPQDETAASLTKLIEKKDGLINLTDSPEENLRKVMAYSTWPNAYFFFKNKKGKEIRIVVKDAVIKDGQFFPTRVIPAGKREMDWQDFLRGNA